MKVDQRIHHLYEDLSEAGLEVVLAGGACRDMYHGKVPKDYDFLILGTDWTAYSVNIGTIINAIADEGTILAVVQQSYSGNLRCGDVWEFQYRGLLVNIISPCLDGDGPWHTVQDVLDHFDTSLNVIYYDFETDSLVADPRFAGLTGRVEFIAHPDHIGYTRTEKRYNRLYEKYPDLDWSAVKKYLATGEAGGVVESAE